MMSSRKSVDAKNISWCFIIEPMISAEFSKGRVGPAPLKAKRRRVLLVPQQ